MVEVRTIAVMGATGNQGRGVVDALSFTKGPIQYKVRPMTRSWTSKLAQAFIYDYPQLSLVKWQQDDADSIQRCFEGCYGAFITSGSHLSPEITLEKATRAEIALAERCIVAAKAAGISHVIYPTFPSIFNKTNGSVNIRHFETKHQITLQIQASSIPSTILCPGPFYTDFNEPHFGFWEGDTLILTTPAAPSKSMGWADPGHDIGWFTRKALDIGPNWMSGNEVPVCGQSILYSELAERFTAVTGTKAKYRQCSVDEFEARSQSNLALRNKEVRTLGEWLVVAPDENTAYGTIEMDRLLSVEMKLGIKALSWDAFLQRTGWQGPPK